MIRLSAKVSTSCRSRHDASDNDPAVARERDHLAGRRLGRLGQWSLIGLGALVPRLYLLAHFGLELSEDGFAAVKTLELAQTQGLAGLPSHLVDRILLHPLYMLLLGGLRLVVPAQVDFFLPARLLSVVISVVAVVLMFECVRRHYGLLAGTVAAVLLSFTPTFLWESVSIISPALFLSLYLAVWLALFEGHHRTAAVFAFLAAITRCEGLVLIALVALSLLIGELSTRRLVLKDWLSVLGSVLGFVAVSLLLGWWLAGEPLCGLGTNSMASVWLQTLAPSSKLQRALYFITGYPRLFPEALVGIAVAGAVLALAKRRGKVTGLLLLTSLLFLIFDELLVWFDLTTLEERFLLYPALPFLALAGVGLAEAHHWVVRSLGRVLPRARATPALETGKGNTPAPSAEARTGHRGAANALAGLMLMALLAFFSIQSWQRAWQGMLWIEGNHASQQEVAARLEAAIPADQTTNILAYAGTSYVLDHFARQRDLDLHMAFFRFIPEDGAEQFLLDADIQYILFPRGNPFAVDKYPCLEEIQRQEVAGISLVPLDQFASEANGQEFVIWAIEEA